MGSILSLALAASLAGSSTPGIKPSASVTGRPLTQSMLRISGAAAARPSVAVTATVAAKQAGGRAWVSRHPVRAGALIGAAAGFGIGLIGMATYDRPEGRSCSTAAAAPAFGAIAGALVGTCLGLVASLLQ